MSVTSHSTTVLNTSTFDTVSMAAGPVNQPPTVSITAPVTGATFQTPATVSIAASASDADGTISSVQFFANGEAIGTDTTSPYSISWNQSTLGSYTLTAVATDSGTAQAASAGVTISIANAPPPLPSPWAHADIGAVGPAGSATYTNGVFTVKGAGADIWNSADAFHYVYQPFTGDGQITARVTSLQNTHTFARAGVMFRGDLTANSPHVMLGVRPGGGVEFISRGATNGSTTFHGGQAVPLPSWLKLIRRGHSFASYTSADGALWTQLGSVNVPLTQAVYVGLPVMSHTTTALTTATLDTVTVSTDTTLPSSTISFRRKGLAVGGTTSGSAYGIPGFDGPTSLQRGPDGRLYVATFLGKLYILTLDQAALASPTQVAVTHVQQLDDIYLKPSRTCNINGDPFRCEYSSTTGSGRLVTGLLVDPASTSDAITLYVSNSGWGQGTTDISLDTYSGIITRLTLVPDTATTNPHDLRVGQHTDLLVGLPRSREVHAVNGMSIGPDGWLYLAVGGNTNAGKVSNFFANLPEYYLSASVVRLNPAQLGGRPLPIDVSGVRSAADMAPLAGVFELYATGYRNGYDLTWHSNGKLYLNDNASNLGQGNTPGASEGCNTPSIAPGNRADDLNLVTPGAYGGHPNPTHGECVFDGGELYSPPLTPHASYVPPLLAYANGSSTNGIAEYRSDAFNGLMRGNLISATYAGNQNVRRVVLNSTGTAVLQEHNLATFSEPLDVDTDLAGNIYVAEYAVDRITMMIPAAVGACPVPGTDPANIDSDGDGYKDADETANSSDPCSPASRPADFDGDHVSDLNDPDDDDDGIVDASDQLFFDGQNGAATNVPLGFEYDPTEPARGFVVNTGFRGVQVASSGVRLSPFSIKAGDAGGHLTFTTHAGTAAGAANNQVNALQIGLDSTSAFRIHTRIVQPFSSTTPGPGHAGGIFFGPDQNNFFRVALVGTAAGGMAVQAGLETSGAFVVRGSADLAAGPVSSVDLVLAADPATGTVAAYVDVNATGTLVPVTTGVAVPAAWFSNNSGTAANTSLGGIMTTHGDSAPTAFGFDFFRIDRPASTVVSERPLDSK
jgi:glucose/arabinose dehydrogenase